MMIAIFSVAVVPLSAMATTAEENGDAVYDPENGTVTYVNKNGEENRYETEALMNGTTIVRFFVDDELQHTSAYAEVENGSILRTQMVDGVITQESIVVSDRMTCMEIPATVSTASTNSSAIFRGNIFFNPRVVNGVSYERVLAVSYEYVNGDYGVYTINGMIGDFVSDVAALLAAGLMAYINIPMAFYIAFLVDAFVEFIINDVIVAAFTEDVMAYNGMYDIYSENVAMGSVMEHYGYTHRLVTDDVLPYEDIYLEGYLPFGDDNIARQMFVAHWGSAGTEWTGINYYVESPDYPVDF